MTPLLFIPTGVLFLNLPYSTSSATKVYIKTLHNPLGGEGPRWSKTLWTIAPFALPIDGLDRLHFSYPGIYIDGDNIGHARPKTMDVNCLNQAPIFIENLFRV